MKKYLFAFMAVLIALVLCAFTGPNKSALFNYYRFSYIPTYGYPWWAVEDESPMYWGYGTLVLSVSDFTQACDGVDDKACEIIVDEGSTVYTAYGRRLKSVQAGDFGAGCVSVFSIKGSENNAYGVSYHLSVNVDDVMNRD